MNDRRSSALHFLDAYNALVRAKKLVAIAQSATASDAPDELTDANRSRIERAVLHCADAIASLKATLETP